jgi:hypothetical protein
MPMADAERLLIEVTVAAPVDAVWRALRDPAEIRRWFGWDYDGLDGEIHLIFEEGAQASEPDRVIRWSHGDQFTLLARGDHTVVRLTRAAPAEGDWSGVYDDVDEGWVAFVHQLRFALERHPAEDRRTLYLTGHAREPGATLLDRLGLGASADADGRYEAAGTPDGKLSGEVWFRSGNLTGLTVDAFGDGLVVVTTSTAEARPPHGGGSMTLTTYGLDDASFDRLRRRWTGWWNAHYDATDSETGGDQAQRP